MADTCAVTALHSYPVKSCQGASVPSARLTPYGLEGDRQFLVMEGGKFINQSRFAKLATVGTRRIDAGTVEFSVGDRSLAHTATPQGEESTIDFYGSSVTVVDQGEALADLLSEALGRSLRVAAMKDTFERVAPLEEFALVDGTQQAHFVDLAPILVTNVASLDDLNGRLDAAVPMNRFRPNIVIEGLDAFGEDSIATLEGDGFRLERATYCERCATTCTDQETGARSSEPLATLKAYRHRENGFAGGVMFGAYMAVSGEGTIRVGDELTVTRAAT